jgi:hypothetical protein
MTTNEQELINLIREQEDPARALATAVDIILLYLEQHGSSQEQVVADLRELA